MTHTTQPSDSIVSRLGGVTRRTLGRLRPGSASGRAADSRPRRLPPRERADRGVSEIIGFILLFGLLMLGLTIVQLYGVPTTNERLEFEHNQRVQTDVAEVSDLLSRVAATGAPGSATVEAGMQYPSRLFMFNPPPVTGSLQTTGTDAVVVGNATSAGDVGDYWDGTDRSFATTSITYEPFYNLYDFAPTRVVEHGLVYDRFDSGEFLPRNRAPLIEGRTITLLALSGEINTATPGTVLVEATPVSVPGEPVTVSGTGGPVTITLPSGLSADEMRTVLESELVANGGHVVDVRNGTAAGTVTVVLEAGESYDLALGHLQVGAGSTPSEDAHYVVPVTDSPFALGEGANGTVGLEVRDRFDNPVSGVTVHAATTLTDSSVAPTSAVTDQDGRVRFDYLAPANINGVAQVGDEVRATIGDPAILTDAGYDAGTREEASVGVRVQNLDRSGIKDPTAGPSAGYGGISYWLSNETSQTFSVANGKWLDIGQINEIRINDGELATREVCKSYGQGTSSPFAECRIVDELRLAFTVWNANDAYAVDLHLRDANRNGVFGDLDPPQGQQKVDWSDIQQLTVTNSAGQTEFQRDINATAINAMLQGGSGMDILTFQGQYATDGSGNQASLDLVKLSDATWFTGEMVGRLVVTIP